MTLGDDNHQIARMAVKEAFYVLGVDIDDAEQVEEFRRDLRFAGDLRHYTGRGFGALAMGIAGIIGAGIWSAIQRGFQ